MTPRRLVFVLGVGRCGTRSLASVFDDLPDVFSVHEPQPSLIDLAELAFKGHVVRLGQLHELRRELDNFPYYIESSIWNCWLVPSFLQLWPHARFIWLTRNVFEWAYSAYRRGWYLPLAEQQRDTMVKLRPQPIWPQDVSRWFKLGYLWQVYHKTIARSLQNCKAPWIMLDVKSLNSIDVLENLRMWCGFPGTVSRAVHENKGDLYLTTRELSPKFQGAPGDHLDVPLHISALKEKGIADAAALAAEQRVFKGLAENSVKDLSDGMYWASTTG
jgi:hypothetical protein